MLLVIPIQARSRAAERALSSARPNSNTQPKEHAHSQDALVLQRLQARIGKILLARPAFQRECPERHRQESGPQTSHRPRHGLQSGHRPREVGLEP